MEQRKEVKRVTYEDLDWFWREHGIGVADIRQIPGYEDIKEEADGMRQKFEALIEEEPIQPSSSRDNQDADKPTKTQKLTLPMSGRVIQV